MTVKDFFRQTPRAAAAFSGGTDSALLLYLAKQNGCDVHAYYVKTAFQPEFELEDARRLAGELDIPMTVVELDILAVPEAAANGPDRCYHCKRAIFTALQEAARETGMRSFWTGPTHPMTRATGRACGRSGNWGCARRFGNAGSRKRRCACFPGRPGCSPWRNRRMPVLPPGSRPGQRSGRTGFGMWSGRKRR